MSIEWKDVTSYQRGQERKATCWEIDDRLVRVTIVWGHRDRPGMWVFHCHQLDCDTQAIPGLDRLDQVEEAKKLALAICLNHAAQLQEHLREAYEETRRHKPEEAPVNDCDCRTCCAARGA